MKCKFCPNKDLLYFWYAHCERCRTNYTFGDSANSKIIEYSFSTIYKNIAYKAIFNLVDNRFTIKTVLPPVEDIVIVDSLPNVTPFNFYSKLGTYILFS